MNDLFNFFSFEFQNELKNVKTKPTNLLFCIHQDGSSEYYDSYLNSCHISKFSLRQNTLRNQNGYQLALLNDNILYAFGGSHFTDKMWSRDLSEPSSSKWTVKTPMNIKRINFSSVVFNNVIYIFGGESEKDILPSPLFFGPKNTYECSCERYDTELNQWSMVANMNSGRVNASAAVFNGYIYIAGGKNKLWKTERSVERYCPETDTWREVAPMTTERSQFALTPFAGRLWAIGGRDGDSHTLSSCESYDPVTDTWREEAQLKEQRREHAATEFNGELYVVGGTNGK